MQTVTLKSGRLLTLEDLKDPSQVERIREKFASRCETCNSASEKLQLCSGCYLARYCSRDCQRKDYPSHRNQCSFLSRIRNLETRFSLHPSLLLETEDYSLLNYSYSLEGYRQVPNNLPKGFYPYHISGTSFVVSLEFSPPREGVCRVVVTNYSLGTTSRIEKVLSVTGRSIGWMRPGELKEGLIHLFLCQEELFEVFEVNCHNQSVIFLQREETKVTYPTFCEEYFISSVSRLVDSPVNGVESSEVVSSDTTELKIWTLLDGKYVEGSISTDTEVLSATPLCGGVVFDSPDRLLIWDLKTVCNMVPRESTCLSVDLIVYLNKLCRLVKTGEDSKGLEAVVDLEGETLPTRGDPRCLITFQPQTCSASIRFSSDYETCLQVPFPRKNLSQYFLLPPSSQEVEERVRSLMGVIPGIEEGLVSNVVSFC